MIGLVTDSNSQLPRSIAERYAIEVVPLTVTIDGVDHLEGEELTDVDFYRAWDDGHVPEIETSQPSPGAFIEVYSRLVACGVTEILSIHLTEAMSGTLNSARLAADAVAVPVRLVDSGTASFGISCCVWAAAEAIARGADLEAAASIAQRQADQTATVFIVGVPDLAVKSGRVDGTDVADAAAVGIPVLSLAGGELAVLDTVTTIDEAVAVMAGYALDWEPGVDGSKRIAIGTSDLSSGAVSAALTDRLRDADGVHEIVQYTIGPSVGAHTGPGTAGLFVF